MKTELLNSKLAVELLGHAVNSLRDNVELFKDPNLTPSQFQMREDAIKHSYEFITKLIKNIHSQLNYLKNDTEKMIKKVDEFELAHNEYVLKNALIALDSLKKQNPMILSKFDIPLNDKETLSKDENKELFATLQNMIISSIDELNLTTDQKAVYIDLIEGNDVYKKYVANFEINIEDQASNLKKMREIENDINVRLNRLNNKDNFKDAKSLIDAINELIKHVNGLQSESKNLAYPPDYIKGYINKNFQNEFFNNYREMLVDYLAPQILAKLPDKNFNFTAGFNAINAILSNDQQLVAGNDYVAKVMLHDKYKQQFSEKISILLHDRFDVIWQSTNKADYPFDLKKFSTMARSILEIPNNLLKPEQLASIQDHLKRLLDEALINANKEKITPAAQLNELLTALALFDNVKQKIDFTATVNDKIEAISNTILSELDTRLQEISSNHQKDDVVKCAEKINLLQEKLYEFNRAMPGSEFEQKLPKLYQTLNAQLNNAIKEAQAKIDESANNKKLSTYHKINDMQELLTNIYGESPKEIIDKCDHYKKQFNASIEEKITDIAKRDDMPVYRKIKRINTIIEFMELNNNANGKQQLNNLIKGLPGNIEAEMKDLSVLKKLSYINEIYKAINLVSDKANDPIKIEIQKIEKQLAIQLSQHLTQMMENCYKELSLEKFFDNPETNISYQKMIQLNNKVTEYMMHELCAQSDEELRRSIIMRWITICENCIKNGDITTAKGITSKMGKVIDMFPITFAGLSQADKEKVMNLSLLSIKSGGWKEVIENKERVTSETILPDIADFTNKLIGLYALNKSWNDSGAPSEFAVPLMNAINRSKDLQITTDSEKTRDNISSVQVGEFAEIKSRDKYENNSKRQQQYRSSKESNEKLYTELQRPKPENPDKKSEKRTPTELTYITAKYDQVSVINKYDENLSNVRMNEGHQKITTALNDFKYKSNLTLTSSLKPLDQTPLSNEEFKLYIQKIKSSVSDVQQKKEKLEIEIAELTDKISQLSQGEKRLNELSKILTSKLSPDEKNELELLRKAKVTLSEFKNELGQKQIELTKLEPVISDLKIIQSLDQVEKPSDLKSEQLALFLKYFQFSERIKTSVSQDNQIVTNRYSFTVGTYNPFSSSYLKQDGSQIDGVVQDYFVMKNGQLYKRDLEKRKSEVENFKESTKTADRVAKLLTDVRDIVEIDIKKELCKDETKFLNPQHRVDTVDSYFFIIDQKFESVINKIQQTLNQQEGGYYPKYKESAEVLLNELIAERKRYQTLHENVKTNILKLVPTDEVLLQRVIEQKPQLKEERPMTHIGVGKEKGRLDVTLPNPQVTVEAPKNPITSTLPMPQTQTVTDGVKSSKPSEKQPGFFARLFTTKQQEKTGTANIMLKLAGGNKDDAIKGLEVTSQRTTMPPNNETTMQKQKEKMVDQNVTNNINYICNTTQPNTLSVNTNISQSSDLTTVINTFIKDSNLLGLDNKSPQFNLKIYCRDQKDPGNIQSKIDITLTRSQDGSKSFKADIDISQLKDYDKQVAMNIIESLKKRLATNGYSLEVNKPIIRESVDTVKSITEASEISQWMKNDDPIIKQQHEHRGTRLSH